MKTILAATLLALSATSVAAQTTFYGPGGDYLGQGARHRNTTTFYDASGSFVGSSVTAFDQFLWSRWLLSGHLDPHRRRHKLL
jgi:hypothetical protein